MGLLGYLGSTFADEQILDQHCYVAAVATSGLPGYVCQRASPGPALLWCYWGYLQASFANEQILGRHCYVAAVCTSGLPGYLCQRTRPGPTLLWGYWGYLGSTFANGQVLAWPCYAAIEATSWLPLPTSNSWLGTAVGLLRLPWGQLRQRANPGPALVWGYWGYLGASFANDPIPA